MGAISPYLVEGPWVLVVKRSKPLANLPAAVKGSQPTDGGNLIVEATAYAEVAADPVAAKYLRRYVGARELIHNTPRWCLWLEKLDPADLTRSRLLKERLDAVRAFRVTSTKQATKLLAATPHLFTERRAPQTDYLCIPRHVSETRAFFTASRFGPEVISGDANFVVVDPEGLAFAVISSSALNVHPSRAVASRPSGCELAAELTTPASSSATSRPAPRKAANFRLMRCSPR